MKATRAVLESAERHEEALELRALGYRYREIGERLGVSRQRAHAMVKRELDAIREQRAEKAEHVRILEVERLDNYLATLRPKIEGGDVRAIEVSLKVMERRSKLLGLDAAQEIDVRHGELTPSDARRVMSGLFGSVTPETNGKSNGSNGHAIPAGNGMSGGTPQGSS